MKGMSIKTPEEVEIMAQGGKMLAIIRDEVAKVVKPGVTALELDEVADRLITKTGGEASFKRVPGYKHATCININEEVVHGIPTNRRIKPGDLVAIDVGLYYQGFNTDTSVSVAVEPVSPEIKKFLEVGRAGLALAIAQAKPGRRIADLSKAMQETVENAGYSVVRALTGHGVGRELHEEPAIPCFTVGKREHSPLITVGMVLAIEIMYNQGRPDVAYKNGDGWTIVTTDGKISGLFEETVAVTKNGPIVLTKAT